MTLLHGDCVEVMRSMPENSVDAVVTDPPYGLEFMGKEWDQLNVEKRGRTNLMPSKQHIAKGMKLTGSGNPTDRLPSPSYAPKKNPRCRKCNHLRFDKEKYKCKCESPDLDTRTAEYARDMQAWHEAWAREALRVLKPGGYLIAFGGTRTYHRLASAIEDAGLEIRDSITWIYGSGFPKSLDVSKAIDKMAGAEREVVGVNPVGGGNASSGFKNDWPSQGNGNGGANITTPATEAAKQWEGFGTALKPAHEPIVVARKPLSESSVARNVLEHGTGALNIDGSRIAAPGGLTNGGKPLGKNNPCYMSTEPDPRMERALEHPSGRWPANVVLSHVGGPDGCQRVGVKRVRGDFARRDNPNRQAYESVSLGRINPAKGSGHGYVDSDGFEEVEAWECADGCPVAELDRQSGPAGAQGKASGPRLRGVSTSNSLGRFSGVADTPFYGDKGGASRFFLNLDGEPGFKYQAKASRKDRGEGNTHPTVKPLALMRYLVKLVTPPGGVVLDPFAGSGSTLVAGIQEGFEAVGIEQDAFYIEIAERRIAHARKEIEAMPLALEV